ncbi:carotenoid biosynthesis protein [Hymenobacter guriensis]|uniref:Carotenoid biosynthesis protein n=1 Tax=Hymenobacter guriensis TaxID=2793065 RepID=A0ABS0L9T5_9BACT|nr:carotenoid biosynthesis protein [Hymenobacter guriensis]MBG8556379.1 carotenoid biosynthesis protein [Hymenobacter guriensis]
MPTTDSTLKPPAAPPATPPGSRQRLRVAQGIILLFHVTGFIGLGFSQDPDFYLRFVPLNLLLTAALLLAFQAERSAGFYAFCFMTMLVGFGVEVLGVQNKIIFGNYVYGPVLGFGVLGVPLVIGLNWLMLTYMAGVLARYLPLPDILRAVVAAVLMVGMDVCIEPVAVQFDFWSWMGNVIPLQNFKAWLAVSFILQIFFNRSQFLKRNELVPFVYLVQLLFFFGLGLLS